MSMTLKELATSLGMSKTTVSRALNGYPEVGETTRQKVLAAAQAAGYEANPMARSLAVGRTNVVGLIYPLEPADLGDPMFLGVVGGMAAALEARKMNLMIAPVTPENELPSYEQMVKGRRVDGLIVSRTLVHDPRINYLAKRGFPFIAHGRTQLDQPYAWFDYDNEAGIRLAVEHLVALGHSRISLISAPLELNFARQRLNSFINAMSTAGMPVHTQYLSNNVLDRRGGYQAVQALLACSPRPTAIIVDNHLAGVGVIRALLDAGIEIGEEISVVVWGSVADTLGAFSITTIDQPCPKEAGTKMSEMLLALINGTKASELQVLWQPVLLTGTSTGICRS